MGEGRRHTFMMFKKVERNGEPSRIEILFMTDRSVSVMDRRSPIVEYIFVTCKTEQ